MSELTRTLLFGGLGAVVLALAFVDLFVTTLTVGGTGYFTRRLPPLLWRLTRATGRRGAMAYAGMMTLLGIAAVWILLLWGGWLLVFSADPWSVVVAQTGRPAGLVERTYFVGYTLFTLGLGDYRPHGGTWQMLTVLVVGSGLTAVTLIISYIVPVVSAAAQRRALASHLAALGRSPRDILHRAWNGRDFQGLEPHLQGLVGRLTQQAQQHQVYPVLSNFHPPDPDQALAVRLAALEEALLLLRHAAPSDVRPRRGEMEAVRDAATALLATLPGSDRLTDGAPPPPPDPGVLRAFGLTPCPEADWRRAVAAEDDRRKRLRALVETEGWSWRDVGCDEVYPSG